MLREQWNALQDEAISPSQSVSTKAATMCTIKLMTRIKFMSDPFETR
jgi:hypothetical protein